MLRFSHRFAAALVAATLLIAPLAVQAAPAKAAPPADAGWASAMLAGLENAAADGWNWVVAALGLGNDTTTTAPTGTLDGTTMEAVPPDSGTDFQPSFDPDGSV